MSRYPDECHLIIAIGLFFFGIGMIVSGVGEVNTLPNYSGCEDEYIYPESYCRNSREETAERIQDEGESKIYIGIAIIVFAIPYSACLVSSISKKYRT